MAHDASGQPEQAGEGTSPPIPLPELDDRNRFFWQAGREGRLAFTRCRLCGRFAHPPPPVCPSCAGDDLEVAAVSGRAVVVGVTVNHHRWLAAFEPPFVLASVAIEEDPRIRLTTRLVACDPAEAHVGMAVEVRFERHDDVWLPLFAPRPGADGPVGPLPADDHEPETIRRSVRPMRSPTRFEDRVALTGIGRSAIGRRLMRDPLAFTVEACRAAVADAGLEMDDIDGLATYPGAGSPPGFGEGGITAVEDLLRVQPTWYYGGDETFGPAGPVIEAMLAVASGLCRHVLCFRTVWQSTYAELARTGRIRATVQPNGMPIGQSRVAGSMQWLVPFGFGSAANALAMAASNHFHRYGTTRETLGWIALTARANAARNPGAIYRDPLTMEDYLGARPISTPLGLYDCDVPCDGAIAVVVSSRDAAADLAQPPVLVEAVGTQLVERIPWDQSTTSHEPQVLGPAAHLWTRTSLRPDDVDVALLYDGFTFNCLSWLEALGFCGIGEAGDFLDGGRAIAPGGVVALNPHGGQLSAGRTHGMGFVHEAVVQLRGAAGERQVSPARVAVVTSGGLTPSGVLLLRSAS